MAMMYLTQQAPSPFRCKRELRSSDRAKPKPRLCEPWVVAVSYFRAAKRRQRVNGQGDLLMLSSLAGLNRANWFFNPRLAERHLGLVMNADAASTPIRVTATSSVNS